MTSDSSSLHAERTPAALVFATDLPSTRARRSFEARDIDLVRRVPGPRSAEKALWDNAIDLNRVKP